MLTHGRRRRRSARSLGEYQWVCLGLSRRFGLPSPSQTSPSADSCKDRSRRGHRNKRPGQYLATEKRATCLTRALGHRSSGDLRELIHPGVFPCLTPILYLIGSRSSITLSQLLSLLNYSQCLALRCSSWRERVASLVSGSARAFGSIRAPWHNGYERCRTR